LLKLNKNLHYEHIYFNIKLYENKSGHYKHTYFNTNLHENKSGHYCNLGHEWLGLLQGPKNLYKMMSVKIKQKSSVKI
jgi:hypothetical protein